MVGVAVDVEQADPAALAIRATVARSRPSLMLMTHSSTAAEPRTGVPAMPIREDQPGTVTPVNLGAPELLIVLLVILVLFGGAKLPKLARSLGQAQSEFKKGLKDTPPDDDDEPKA